MCVPCVFGFFIFNLDPPAKWSPEKSYVTCVARRTRNSCSLLLLPIADCDRLFGVHFMSAQVAAAAAAADVQNRPSRLPMAGRGPGPMPPMRQPIVVDREKVHQQEIKWVTCVWSLSQRGKPPS